MPEACIFEGPADLTVKSGGRTFVAKVDKFSVRADVEEQEIYSDESIGRVWRDNMSTMLISGVLLEDEQGHWGKIVEETTRVSRSATIKVEESSTAQIEAARRRVGAPEDAVVTTYHDFEGTNIKFSWEETVR